MPEGSLHRELKAAARRWLWERGYAAVAEEVVIPSLGVVDVAAAGVWKRANPREPSFDPREHVDRHHVVFVECKASRADYLHDLGRQMHFAFALQERAARLTRSRRHRRWRHACAALGKFDTCLVRPFANLHYVLTPPKLLQARELPRRWGWLVSDGASVRVVRRAAWQDVAEVGAIEGAIARALTRRVMAAPSVERPCPAEVAEPAVPRWLAVRVAGAECPTAAEASCGEPRGFCSS
ncbi:MAG: hypothetical protein C4547_14625 [Phycisphaerales bacterium]|nr:MAG: hypothetical protein C4547_14625 [Phycisphaerales bacterium]